MTRNSLLFSAMRMGGGKIDPRTFRTLPLLMLCAIVCACSSQPSSSAAPLSASTAVEVPASVFHCRDSVMFYAEQGYEHNDPKGQFVVGACYYLRQQGELPEHIAVTTHAEADTMLMLSAAQGYQPALDLIRCLRSNGCWNHEFPNNE